MTYKGRAGQPLLALPLARRGLTIIHSFSTLCLTLGMINYAHLALGLEVLEAGPLDGGHDQMDDHNSGPVGQEGGGLQNHTAPKSVPRYSSFTAAKQSGAGT